MCQQPLSAEAVQRRTTFESFVKGTTKADEETASKVHDAMLAKAIAARMRIDSIRQLQSLIATEIGDIALAPRVREYGIRAAWRLRAFAREQAAPGVEPGFAEATLSDLSKSLGARASQLSADQNSPEHLALLKEFNELKDRAALVPLLEDIKAEIGRRKKAVGINKALKDTAKKTVTTKNKDFSDKLVTNALRGRFAREVEKMKLARMPIKLKKIKDQNAVSYFQVCLVEKPKSRWVRFSAKANIAASL